MAFRMMLRPAVFFERRMSHVQSWFDADSSAEIPIIFFADALFYNQDLSSVPDICCVLYDKFNQMSHVIVH